MGSSTFGPTQISDGEDTATITPVGPSRAVDVNVVQSVGGGGGSGTQYTEGDATDPAVGTVALVRNGAGLLEAISVSSPAAIHGTTFHNDPLDDNLNRAVRIAGMDTTQNFQLDATVTPSGGHFCIDVNVARADAEPIAVDTELPTPTTPVDGAGLIISPTVQTIGTLYNGVTTDLMRGNATDGVLVNLGTNNDVRISDGTDIADVFDLANSNPVATAIVDGSGNQITSFGGGTQYTEGDTDTTITGTAIMFESNTGTSTLSVVNNTTPLPVSDAGGSLTVDGAITVSGTVTANQGTPAATANRWPVQITDGTDLALVTAAGEQNVLATAQPGVDIGDVTINNAGAGAAVNIQDGGNSITVDGTVAVSGTVAVTQSTSPWVTADNQTIADNAGFTDGTSKVLAAGYVFDDVAGTALTENDAAAARIDSKRAQVLVIEDATTRGQKATVTAANALKVDGSAVTQPVSGTVTANQGTSPWVTADNQTITDNAGFTDGTSKVLTAGFIFDEVAGTALTENDAAAARVDSKRAQVLVLEDATTRGQRATVTAANALKVDGSAVTQPVSLAANQSVNVAQLAGTTISVNNGTADAGTLRVTVASNSTGNIATIGTSVTPGTAAANLGKAEDGGHTTGDVGVFILGVRNDNGATTFTNANSDYCPIGVTNNGSLFLASVIPGTTATELGKAEDGASAGGDTGVAALGIRRDTPVANANVNADGDYTQILLDNLGKLWTAQTQTEDAAHASGDRGAFILGVRNTANTTLAGTDADYAPIAVDIMSGAISGVRRSNTTLTAINTTYDDSPTTATSATVDCSMFRTGVFVAEVTESGTATDITFTLQMSPDGTTWTDERLAPWTKYRFDDATIAAHTSSTLKINEGFICRCSNVRMLVTCTGTDASNSFTVANAKFEFVN